MKRLRYCPIPPAPGAGGERGDANEIVHRLDAAVPSRVRFEYGPRSLCSLLGTHRTFSSVACEEVAEGTSTQYSFSAERWYW